MFCGFLIGLLEASFELISIISLYYYYWVVDWLCIYIRLSLTHDDNNTTSPPERRSAGAPDEIITTAIVQAGLELAVAAAKVLISTVCQAP
jgi:hypothetical protein